MTDIIVIGAQWGDEGKGKIVDLLTSDVKHVVRSQGGNNAGHTIVIGENEYKLHLIPSGILQPHTLCYIGAGCVVDPEVLLDEINTLQKRGIETKNRLFISPYAHVIFSFHRQFDKLQEQMKKEAKIGTTCRGIGPCYADKVNRQGIRFCDFLSEKRLPNLLIQILSIKNKELKNLYQSTCIDIDKTIATYLNLAGQLKSYIAPVEDLLSHAKTKSEPILFEGAQGCLLDINFGTYPYVTSSTTLATGVLAGAGLTPNGDYHILGIAKAYTTRVGNGAFPTEIKNPESNFPELSSIREIATTTGRRRRVGWFDAVALKRSIQLSGFHSIALTKLDVLSGFETIKVCTSYQLDGKAMDHYPWNEDEMERVTPVYETLEGWQEPLDNVKNIDDLPIQAKQYISTIEQILNVPVSYLSMGPERKQTLKLLPIFEKGGAAL